MAHEEQRQHDCVRLIPSENYASKAVLEASGSVLTNKYSEGYAGKRYYEGQDHIDGIERLAISRAKAVFGADHVNVQPYSGSPANLAVYVALLEAGDTVLGMSLPHGGHLTHGWKVSVTGKMWNATQYTVSKETGRLDYDEIRDIAKRERPRMIIAGATAYPRIIDFEAFASIAREVDAFFLADIAHIAGLIAGGVHPSPVPHADVVTTTTHKTLRGPRGGMIMCRKKHRKAINRAVFPGLQGGPHNHNTAGLAVALKEADTPEFVQYAEQVVANSKSLAARLMGHGFDLVTGGSDNHLILFDATSKGSTGKEMAAAMARAGLVANANTVPWDPRTPFDPSGVRIGTPAVTSRGMKEAEMEHIGDWIARVAGAVADAAALDTIAAEVRELCGAFTAPGLEHLAG
ncbi:MAG: glycine hydroxymethyltransferase [Myxococcota bacterium]